MRKLIGSIFWSVSLLVVAGLGYRAVLFEVYAQSQISVRPYLMESDDMMVSDSGERRVAHTVEVRRRDGAVHRVGTLYGPKGEEIFRGVREPDGTVAFISDAAHAKSTGKRPAEEQDSLNADLSEPPPAECAEPGETVAGEERLFGQQAFHIISQQSNDNTQRFERWRLPEFHCLTVQSYIEKLVGEDWKITQASRLTRFTEVDPPAELFTNWLSYDEMKPSDIARRLCRMTGKTAAECACCVTDDPSDVNYEKWRIAEKP